MRHRPARPRVGLSTKTVVLAALSVVVRVLAAAEPAADAPRPPANETVPAPFRAEPVAVDQPVTLPAGLPDTEPARLPAALLPGDGTGWLGMTADDGLVTGRVAVVDVAAEGPAAQAGIRPDDILLELDGKPLRNDEDLAAALASIAPGQRVNAAIGRDGRIEDVVLTAGPRPAAPRARPWADPVTTAPFGAAAVPGAGAVPGSGPAAVPPLSPTALPPLATATPAAPIPAAPRLPDRSVLVPTNTAPAAVVPVAGAERVPVEASASTAAAAAVPAASPWATAPTAAPPAVRSAPGVAAVSPAAVATPGQPPAVTNPPVAAGVSAWGATPVPGAALGPTSVVSVGAAPSAPPAAGFPSAAAPSRVPAAAAPGRLALGVRTVPVDGSMQSRFRLADAGGALVIGVVHDLPASRAGVPPGSVIVALNNMPVRSPQELTRVVSGGTPGVPLPIQYVLPGGEARRADVVLVPLEPSLERALAGSTADAAANPPFREPAPALARRVTVPSTTVPSSAVPSSAVPTISVAPTPAPPSAITGAPPSPAPAAVSLTAATSPQGDVAPLEWIEAILRRLNERIEAIEGRLERIERVAR